MLQSCKLLFCCCKTVTPGTDVTRCGAGAMFFQRCEIAALSLTIDYRPRRVNVAALRAGSFVEVRALKHHLPYLSTCASSPNCCTALPHSTATVTQVRLDGRLSSLEAALKLYNDMFF